MILKSISSKDIEKQKPKSKRKRKPKPKPKPEPKARAPISHGDIENGKQR